MKKINTSAVDTLANSTIHSKLEMEPAAESFFNFLFLLKSVVFIVSTKQQSLASFEIKT